MPHPLGSLISVVLLAVSAARGAPPVKDGFVTTSDGVGLHYLESGSGPSILFVPGWTMPAEIWEPQMRHFWARYRVVAMDPRSQGASDRPTEGHYPSFEIGLLRLRPLGEESIAWIGQFLRRYRRRGAQLADAALMCLAERERIETIFTLDRRDLSVYRLASGRSLELLP